MFETFLINLTQFENKGSIYNILTLEFMIETFLINLTQFENKGSIDNIFTLQFD